MYILMCEEKFIMSSNDRERLLQLAKSYAMSSGREYVICEPTTRISSEKKVHVKRVRN